jgi:hypothetical protein
MSLSLRQAGARELNIVRRRAIRDLSMGRISRAKCDRVLELLDQAQSTIYEEEVLDGNPEADQAARSDR